MEMFSEITEKIGSFIAEQHMFFVATASREGHINLSPKGLDTFRVIDPHQVAYLDYVGSGNETAAHLLEDGRITILFCAFDGAANIVRLFGRGEAIREGHPDFETLRDQFAPRDRLRQIMRITISDAQTSCGYGVPLMQFENHRETLDKWTNSRTNEEYAAYQVENNTTSIDGLPTR